MTGLLRIWPRLDPRTGIAVFAVWSGLFGVTLASPGEAFPVSPIYSVFIRLGVPERLLGTLVLLSAAAFFYSITPVASLTTRLLVAYVCGAFWVLIGAALLTGGAQAGIFSGAGGFALAGGFGAMLTINQWMVQP